MAVTSLIVAVLFGALSATAFGATFGLGVLAIVGVYMVSGQLAFVLTLLLLLRTEDAEGADEV